MYRIVKNSYTSFAWLYGAFIFSWLTLHSLFGDGIWWLALINVMAPYLFLPLIPLLMVSLLYRTSTLYGPILWVTLTFLALYGQQFPFPRLRMSSANEPAIRVMTFNIWGGSRSEETAKVIIQNGWPDVVAIQELTPSMAVIMAKTVGDHYPFQLVDFKNGRLGMGIYSRYPFIELAADSLSNPDWQMQVVQVYAGERTFILYNVHPHATNVYLFLQKGFSMGDAVMASYQSRLTFAHRLIQAIDQRGAPVIVAGDFNSTEQSDVYKVLTNRLTDAYRDAGWGFGHTFPAYSASFKEIPPVAKVANFLYTRTSRFLPSSYLNSLRLFRIDMILHSQELRATTSHVSSAHGESDHLPVLATLQWVK